MVPGHGTLCDCLFLLARDVVLWYLDTGHCVIMFYFYLPGLLIMFYFYLPGLLLRLPYLDEPTGDDLYDDKAWWVVNPFLDEEVPANDSSPSVAADVDAAEMKKFTAISEA